MKFAEVLLEKVDQKDFVAGVVGQNIVLEGMAFNVFEMMHAGNVDANPKFAHTLSGTIADERRHVGFGENRIGSLIKEHPERKADVERMQKEMSYHMLATFGEAFRGGPSQAEVQEILRKHGQERKPAKEQWHGVDLAAASPEELEAVLSGHRAEGVQDPARPDRPRLPDADCAVTTNREIQSPEGRTLAEDPHRPVARGLPRAGAFLRVLVRGRPGLPGRPRVRPRPVGWRSRPGCRPSAMP